MPLAVFFSYQIILVPFLLYPSLSTPSCTAASLAASLNSFVAILAFSIDFQSATVKAPIPIACDILYIARLACSALAPDIAAQLATPIIADVASSRSIPTDTNLPILLVISVRLYDVSSVNQFNF